MKRAKSEGRSAGRRRSLRGHVTGSLGAFLVLALPCCQRSSTAAPDGGALAASTSLAPPGDPSPPVSPSPAVAPPPLRSAAHATTGPSPAHDLAGTWAATGYTCDDGSVPKEEIVSVAQHANDVTATKVVGDNCVTAGQVTWRGTVHGDSFPVEIQVGPKGGPHHFVGGQAHVRGPDAVDILGPGWSLAYRRTGHPAASH